MLWGLKGAAKGLGPLCGLQCMGLGFVVCRCLRVLGFFVLYTHTVDARYS